MAKRVLCHVQMAEMKFLRRVHGVTLRDQVHSYEICENLNVELLIFRISDTMVRSRDQDVPSKIVENYRLRPRESGTDFNQRPVFQPKTSDCIFDLARSCLCVEPEKISEVAENCDVILDVLGIGVARGPCLPQFVEHIVTLWFERWYPKQSSGIRLKSNILAPPNFLPPPNFWAGYATAPGPSSTATYPEKKLVWIWMNEC